MPTGSQHLLRHVKWGYLYLIFLEERNLGTNEPRPR